MTIKVWVDWVPQWAPTHIKAKHEPRSFHLGLPEEQRIVCECLHCGTVWKTTCLSGNARRHIQTFAIQHLHGKGAPNEPTEAP